MDGERDRKVKGIREKGRDRQADRQRDKQGERERQGVHGGVVMDSRTRGIFNQGKGSCALEEAAAIRSVALIALLCK